MFSERSDETILRSGRMGNQDELMEDWALARAMQPLKSIHPLE
jgi:hypothetical protein